MHLICCPHSKVLTAEGGESEEGMKKGLTELVFILDRSGSMSGLEADTIGGFNSLIEKQKKEEGEACVSVVLFDDQNEVLYDRVDLKKIGQMNDKQYYVRGCTALLDAVGGAIHHIGRVQKQMPDEEKPEKTLFIITTDGMENSSRQYSYDKVKKMVENKKNKRQWEFIFLGANMDAVQVANQFGVNANRAVRFESDGMGTELNFSVMSKMVSVARGAASAPMMACALDSDGTLDEIREDYEEFEAAKKIKDEKAAAVTEEEKRMMEESLDELGSDRERKIAELLFGLNGNRVHTFREVAGILMVNETRAKQVSSRVVKWARKKIKTGGKGI